jgi:hypothetical protein
LLPHTEYAMSVPISLTPVSPTWPQKRCDASRWSFTSHHTNTLPRFWNSEGETCRISV